MVEYQSCTPTCEEWKSLRRGTKWTMHSDDNFKCAIQGSLHFVLAYEEGEIIGMGRVVGDTKLCFYIQDVVVKEKYRRQGIGSTIVKMLLTYINDSAAPGATIGLMASKNKEPFYEKLGFKRRDGVSGFGMIMPLSPN